MTNHYEIVESSVGMQVGKYSNISSYFHILGSAWDGVECAKISILGGGCAEGTMVLNGFIAGKVAASRIRVGCFSRIQHI